MDAARRDFGVCHAGLVLLHGVVDGLRVLLHLELLVEVAQLDARFATARDARDDADGVPVIYVLLLVASS